MKSTVFQPANPVKQEKTFAAEEKMKLDPKKVKVHPARKMKDVLDTWTVKKSIEK